MGILDALLSPQGGGGLLSFLNGTDNQIRPWQSVDPNATSNPYVNFPSISAAAAAAPAVAPQGNPMQARAQMMPDAGTPPVFMQPPTASGLSGAFRGIAANAQAGPLGMLFGGIAGGLGMGQGNPQDIARQNAKAQYDALIPIFKQAGDDDRTAASKAMLAVLNPEVGKQIFSDQFGPGRFSMQMRQNDDGTQTPVVLDNRSGSIVSGGGAPPAPGPAPGQFGNAAPQPAAPPGVNVKAFKEGIAKNAADEAADVQSKAEGAVTALQNFQRLKDKINAADPRAFGPVAGSDTGQYLNSIGGSISGPLGDPFGNQKTAEQQSELASLYKDVGSAMLKARFGSRVTNIDTKIGQQIVGGLSQPNKTAALNTLNNNISEAYDVLAQGIKRGVVNPSEVLQRPQNADQAKSLGPGALYIAPDGSIRRNPK